MSPVAIVTDSASDLDPAVASRLGIVVVPLIVELRLGQLPGRAST